MEQRAEWYVLHTYSGYENKVATNIQKIVENRKLQDYILEVRIPMEKVQEVRNNETVEIERKLFPGYVLIHMVITDDTWLLVRNVRGVTGFVGPEGKAVPLSEAEIANLGITEVRVADLKFGVGDSVLVKDGPLKGFVGVVDEIDKAAFKASVIVSMFGRETPVEVTFDQIEIMK